MRDQDVAAIVAAFRSGAAPGTRSRMVTFDEIEANSWDLSVSRYMPKEQAEVPSVADALAAYKKSSQAFREAEADLFAELRDAGYDIEP
jgi:type I restriction-modification system DNA methylase subunit